MSLEARHRYLLESKRRVGALHFGDPVTNICAGDQCRNMYFVELVTKSHKNRAGIRHNSYFARCRDSSGRFHNTDIKVIYPGHLSESECKKLFEPVWEMEHGTKNT